MQTAFTECSYGKGGHLHPELLIVEFLNDHNKPVEPGQIGEVTITTLGIEGMPLLRYKTGDMAIHPYRAMRMWKNHITNRPYRMKKTTNDQAAWHNSLSCGHF